METQCLDSSPVSSNTTRCSRSKETRNDGNLFIRRPDPCPPSILLIMSGPFCSHLTVQSFTPRPMQGTRHCLQVSLVHLSQKTLEMPRDRCRTRSLPGGQIHIVRPLILAPMKFNSHAVRMLASPMRTCVVTSRTLPTGLLCRAQFLCGQLTSSQISSSDLLACVYHLPTMILNLRRKTPRT